MLAATGARYHLGTGAVGLLALVGAGSVLTSPAAGRRVDRVGPSPVNLICFAIALAAAGMLATGILGGTSGLVGLAAAGVLGPRGRRWARTVAGGSPTAAAVCSGGCRRRRSGR